MTTQQATISDKKACLIAKKYVWDKYSNLIGEPLSISTYSNSTSLLPPKDEVSYSWLIKKAQIKGAEVASREGEQIQVNVQVTLTKLEGSSEAMKI